MTPRGENGKIGLSHEATGLWNSSLASGRAHYSSSDPLEAGVVF